MRVDYVSDSRLLRINGGIKVRTLLQQHYPNIAGKITIRSRTPSGVGFGRSTMDILAVLRAIDPDLSPKRESDIVVSVEGACDPLMYDVNHLPLYEPRTGKLHRYIGRMPDHVLIGGYTDQTADPLAYTNWPDVTDLVDELAPDLKTIARIATESAIRGQQVVYNPYLNHMIDAAQELGALGVVRAHTGSALGWIFAPGTIIPDISKYLNQISLKIF